MSETPNSNERSQYKRDDADVIFGLCDERHRLRLLMSARLKRCTAASFMRCMIWALPPTSRIKSAHIVRDVIGKYIPTATRLYMKRWSEWPRILTTAIPVDGHGNFRSVDGDSAAAMRYTESRMSKIAMELLQDISQETIDCRTTTAKKKSRSCFRPVSPICSSTDAGDCRRHGDKRSSHQLK